MEHQTTLQAINHIFKDVLDNDDVVVTETTTSNDIEEWDSLTHIQLIVAIEKYFGLKFTSMEISASRTCLGMSSMLTSVRFSSP